MSLPERWPAFYAAVKQVPRGRVTTYGQIAILAGSPGYARHVGHALAALRGAKHRVPWHRVLGKRSKHAAVIAILDAAGAAVQRALLEKERVRVSAAGVVDLREYGWPAARPATRRPPAPASPSRSAPRTRGSSGRS